MDAIEDFNTSIEKGSENPGIYDGLGCCFHALKDFEKAIEVRIKSEVRTWIAPLRWTRPMLIS